MSNVLGHLLFVFIVRGSVGREEALRDESRRLRESHARELQAHTHTNTHTNTHTHTHTYIS